jgi:ATP-dependent Zn protease
MITFTIGLTTLFLIIFTFSYTFYIIKNKKSIGYDLSTGVKCYNCKSETGHERLTYEDISNTNNYKLCKSCERDQKLNNIISKFKFDSIKFKRLILNDKFNKKIVFYFIIYTILCIIIDLLLFYFFKFTFLSKTMNLFSFLFSLISLYRTKLVYE